MAQSVAPVLCSLSWRLPISGFHLLLYSRCWGPPASMSGLMMGREEVSRSHSFSGPKLLMPPPNRNFSEGTADRQPPLMPRSLL